MGDVLYPYLVAVVATVVVLTASWFAFLRHHRAATEHQQKAARIPDFVRYLQLKQDVEILAKRHDELQPLVAKAAAVVKEADEARKYLAQHADAIRLASEADRQLLQALQDLEKRQDELKKATHDLELLKPQLAQRQAESDRLDALILDLQARRETAEKDEQAARQAARDAQAAQAKAEAQLAGVAQRRDDAERSLAAHEQALQQKRAALDAGLKSAQEDLDRRLQALAHSLQKAEAEHAQRLAALDRAMDDAKTLHLGRMAALQKEFDDDRELHRLEVEDEQKRRADRLAEMAKQFADDTARLQQQFDKDRARIEAQIEGLEADAEEVEGRVRDAEAKVEDLQATVAQLRETKGTLEGQIARLRSESGGVAGDAGEHVKELFEPAVRAGWSDERPEIDEADALDRVAKHLDNRKIRFNRRVLNAFHTSLKVQADSPLLVLAGISGTGKSLLPQLYAQAMGIHTQIVPVQPRWDGPQDLLGFYHHLEGRFKPTDLTRALLQFDRYLATDQQKLRDAARGDLSDQMLLVLLDEMNLARVEYYFSEFLSRLETRRDVDPKDPQQRSKAAIHLELGKSGDRELSLEVFAGQNVLFVGTINEDESTQTLSDKVVDRANVMRFGCPRNLARPEEAGAGRGQAAPGWLPAGAWSAWIRGAKALDGGQGDLVNRTTTGLKELMASVGRAFAYRTNKAIHAYVQQYPDRSDKGIKAALADQVEQRILPKLRGIDANEDTARGAIDRLLQIVDRDLGDKQLAEAIEEARRSHGFHWQGLDRAD